VSRVIARLRQRLRAEGGYTLSELLVTMVILGIVLAALTGLFSAGLRAETDVAFRSRSQSEARNALSYLRQEVHCASGATWSAASGSPATQTLTLALPAGCFRPAGETAGTPSSWCTVYVSANRYQLYRKSGSTCDSSGKLFADYLTSATVFPSYTAPSASSLGSLNVSFNVDTNSQTLSPNAYRLTDDIVLRNTTRS
jgi:prepilin-type N-terminal cleavage/methylation domain-containing protein